MVARSESGQGVYSIEAVDTELTVIIESLSRQYDVNILVSNKLAKETVTGNISGKNVKQVLDSLAWLLDTEYIFKDNTYYFGGKSKVIEVMESGGLGQDADNLLNENIKRAGDKLIVSGTEYEVKKNLDAINRVIDRKLLNIQLLIIEYSKNKDIQLGVDIEKSIKYSASWVNWLANPSPDLLLATSVIANAKFSEDCTRTKININTKIGLISGSKTHIEIGKEIDRQIYNESQYGNRVVSGFSSQNTGVIIDLEAFYTDSDWYVYSGVETSDSKSELEKTLTKVQNKTKLKDSDWYLISRVKRDNRTISIKKGIPFLCEIPIIGILFAINNRIEYERYLYVYVRKAEQEIINPAPDFELYNRTFKELLDTWKYFD